MATETYSYTVPEAAVLSERNGLEKSYGSPTIKVLGVGGGGCNAVSRMYEEKVPGVDYVVINTDQQHLSRTQVPNKIALRIGPHAAVNSALPAHGLRVATLQAKGEVGEMRSSGPELHSGIIPGRSEDRACLSWRHIPARKEMP